MMWFRKKKTEENSSYKEIIQAFYALQTKVEALETQLRSFKGLFYKKIGGADKPTEERTLNQDLTDEQRQWYESTIEYQDQLQKLNKG